VGVGEVDGVVGVGDGVTDGEAVGVAVGVGVGVAVGVGVGVGVGVAPPATLITPVMPMAQCAAQK